jgi:hypothetical protein
MLQLRTSGKTMDPTRFEKGRQKLQMNEIRRLQRQIYGSETAKLWVK